MSVTSKIRTASAVAVRRGCGACYWLRRMLFGDGPISRETYLDRTFDLWWPDLGSAVKNFIGGEVAGIARRFLVQARHRRQCQRPRRGSVTTPRARPPDSRPNALLASAGARAF